MKKYIKLFFILLIVCSLAIFLYVKNIISKMESPDPLVWESDIREYEKVDEISGFPAGSWLFIGSSSVALYGGLEDLMKPFPIIARGFGGASVSDITFYQSRLIDKYQPNKVIMYAGVVDSYYHHPDNPETVVVLLSKLFDSIHKQNDKVEIFYIAIRPSPFDLDKESGYEHINDSIARMAEKNKLLFFIDPNSSVKDKDGAYRKDIYKYDRTHLNDEGNKLWWAVIKNSLLNATSTRFND